MTEQWTNRIVDYGSESPADLLANPRNFRTHPRHQQDALAGVLRDVGVVQDVIVNRRTGFLLDGHLRVSLALRDSQATIPVKYVDLSEAEEALVLATLDPIAALATVDAAKLDELLRDVSTGDAAVQQMLDDLATDAGIVPGASDLTGDGGDDFDTTPQDGPTRVQRGDLWQLDKHRLLCADSTSAEDVARLMGGERADMVFTDPPYGMNLDTDWSDVVGLLTLKSQQHQTRGNKYDPVIGDDAPFDPKPIFAAFGYCKEIFLWGADYYAEHIPLRTDGSWIVWDKRKDTQADAIGAEFELCWSKAKHKRRMLRHDWFGFLSSQNTKEAQNRVHPNQKPTSLFIDMFQQWSSKAALIVDLYLGSGTTIIAAERTGRRCYGIEIEPKYCDVILRRWEAETGQTAEKVEG